MKRIDSTISPEALAFARRWYRRRMAYWNLSPSDVSFLKAGKFTTVCVLDRRLEVLNAIDETIRGALKSLKVNRLVIAEVIVRDRAKGFWK